MVHFIPPSQRRFALLAAQTESAPVLIHGASGTGKGAIARWIHANGPRMFYPFVIAHPSKPLSTQILEAQGGALFVPEIGKWTLSDQKILINYLKTRSVVDPSQPETPHLANVRIIGTTTQSLDNRAQAGLFNLELLEKLNLFRIEMPPLTQRKEEFEDIVIALVQEITQELQKDHLQGAPIAPAAMDKLKSYSWPGNLRELRNVLRFAVISAKGHRIELEDLPDFYSNSIDFTSTREEFEKIYILELLKTFQWEINRICNMTHIDKNILLNKIKVYGISLENLSLEETT